MQAFFQVWVRIPGATVRTLPSPSPTIITGWGETDTPKVQSPWFSIDLGCTTNGMPAPSEKFGAEVGYGKVLFG
jgi:hypothetical protein